MYILHKNSENKPNGEGNRDCCIVENEKKILGIEIMKNYTRMWKTPNVARCSTKEYFDFCTQTDNTHLLTTFARVTIAPLDPRLETDEKRWEP